MMKKSMEPQQFDLVVNSKSRAALGARSVLVNNYTYRQAAKEFDISQQAISAFIATHLNKHIKD